MSPPREWNKFVTDFFNERRKTDANYTLRQAMVAASPIFKKNKKSNTGPVIANEPVIAEETVIPADKKMPHSRKSKPHSRKSRHHSRKSMPHSRKSRTRSRR